jgi:hypothetical protein
MRHREVHARGRGLAREAFGVVAVRAAFEAVEHHEPARIGIRRGLEVDVDEVTVGRAPAFASINRRLAGEAS